MEDGEEGFVVRAAHTVRSLVEPFLPEPRHARPQDRVHARPNSFSAAVGFPGLCQPLHAQGQGTLNIGRAQRFGNKTEWVGVEGSLQSLSVEIANHKHDGHGPLLADGFRQFDTVRTPGWGKIHDQESGLVRLGLTYRVDRGTCQAVGRVSRGSKGILQSFGDSTIVRDNQNSRSWVVMRVRRTGCLDTGWWFRGIKTNFFTAFA